MPDSAAALSVLVLAWDEAAPTVRTVVEAAPAVGSLLVLLPPVLIPALPLKELPTSEASLAAPPAASAEALAPSTPLPAALVKEENLNPAVATLVLPTPMAPPAPSPHADEISPLASAAPSSASNHRPRVVPAVRLLHVVASQLPATIRQGSFQVPAAPYLGASAPAPGAAPAPLLQTLATVASSAPSPAPEPNEEQTLSSPAATPLAIQDQEAPEETTTSVASNSSAAPTGEDISPVAGTLPTADTPAAPDTVEPLAEAAFAAAEVVDAEPEDELPPTSGLLPTAATPADSPTLSDSAPTSAFSPLGPFGNRLPQVDPSPPLSSVSRPAVSTVTSDDPEDTPEERARVFAASVAAAQQYTAPDLNSQVIRYARLAVPTALAEGAYEVIYAPAWPTWLAALELRQRTQGPLVLHLPALAAGRQPADTAAGWPAELQRQALRQADLVLVETYALARRLRRELGLGPATVRVVPTSDAAAVARALRRAKRRPSLA